MTPLDLSNEPKMDTLNDVLDLRELVWFTHNDAEVFDEQQKALDHSTILMIPDRNLQYDRPAYRLAAKASGKELWAYMPMWHGTPEHIDSNFYSEQIEAEGAQFFGAYTSTVAWKGRYEKYWYDFDIWDPEDYAGLLFHKLVAPINAGITHVMGDYVSTDPYVAQQQLAVIRKLKQWLPHVKFVLNGWRAYREAGVGHFIENFGGIWRKDPIEVVHQLNPDTNGIVDVVDLYNVSDSYRTAFAEQYAVLTGSPVCRGRMRRDGMEVLR